MWCALIGDNLQVGVARFGTTPVTALRQLSFALNERSGSRSGSRFTSNLDNIVDFYLQIICLVVPPAKLISLVIPAAVAAPIASPLKSRHSATIVRHHHQFPRANIDVLTGLKSLFGIKSIR
jgi:hypothetical protein